MNKRSQLSSRSRVTCTNLASATVLAGLGLFTSCAAETPAEVGGSLNAVVRGSTTVLETGTTSIGFPDGSQVEFSFHGNWIKPVLVQYCEVPFCTSLQDYDNVQAWREQRAYDSATLQIRNLTNVTTTTTFSALLSCVYANGNPLPAPMHTTGSEQQNGEATVQAGESQDVAIECGHGAYQADGAWVVGASIDVSVSDDTVGDTQGPVEDP